MSGTEAIAAVSAAASPEAAALARTPTAQPAPPVSFSDILTTGLNGLENRLSTADELVRRFAVDDTVPIHQVTAALEEARLAIEIAVQVRARLVESYRDIMNMQV